MEHALRPFLDRAEMEFLFSYFRVRLGEVYKGREREKAQEKDP